jgi:hypothetical protein
VRGEHNTEEAEDKEQFDKKKRKMIEERKRKESPRGSRATPSRQRRFTPFVATVREKRGRV